MKSIHAEIKIYGIVQGVGFRPFVHKTAQRLRLFGRVKNTSFGAQIALEGGACVIDKFVSELSENAPRLAYIEDVSVEKSEELCGFSDFKIEKSEAGEKRRTLISPDVGTCDDCKRELFKKGDRRYKYPFINCTNCGPRFTIIKDIPYDRKNTTMRNFPMCGLCADEYGDIEDRRYHAQPDCCDECGPHLEFYGATGERIEGDCIELAKKYLRKGRIVAVKGLGGMHLACLPQNAETVLRLRERKRRDEKPFALMCRDVSCARELAEVSKEEEHFLTSPARPIVLLRKREGVSLPHISENREVGIMLPYTPLHHLLLTDDIKCLVMTSANISELPIIYKNDDAKEKLENLADGFLLHNREIETRCDDSLLRVWRGGEYFIRRSRGYVPYPITLKEKIKASILACGAEQKASFAISRGHHVFPSQHIGDLKNIETLDCYEAQIAHFERLFDVVPEAVACDMHPDYMSGEYARDRAERDGIPLIPVQHHHAHMASCMADNGYTGDCIGIIWDGTGLGTDGRIWGAEMLVGNFKEFSRVGTILPMSLPGGDKCTKELSRISTSLLVSAGVDVPDSTAAKQLASGINCPTVTSMGRLFDGVSALLGIKETASYEGQGAVLLEAAAEENVLRSYPYEIKRENGVYVFDYREMIKMLYCEREKGVRASGLAAAFMNTLCRFATDMSERVSNDSGIKTVALSGGTFQNMYLLARIHASLEEKGFRVLTHRRVSPNDEGISLGQIMIAKENL